MEFDFVGLIWSGLNTDVCVELASELRKTRKCRPEPRIRACFRPADSSTGHLVHAAAELRHKRICVHVVCYKSHASNFSVELDVKEIGLFCGFHRLEVAKN